MYHFFWETVPSYDIKTEKRRFSTLCLAVASIFVVSMLAQLALLLPFLLFAPTRLQSPVVSSLIGSVAMYAIAMPASLLLFGACRPQRKPIKQSLGFFSVLCLLAVSLALTVIGNYIGILVNSLITAITGRETVNPVAEMTDGLPISLAFVTLVILAPVFEELFLRKLVIDRLRHHGDLFAILFSGIVFGLIHGNLSQFFYAALLGILFGAVYCYTGNVLYSIGLHMALNFMGGVYSLIMMRAFGGSIPEIMTPEIIEAYPVGTLMMLGYTTVFGLAFLVFLPALFFLWRRMRPGLCMIGDISRSDNRRILFGSVGFWILATVVALLFLLNAG
jgi:membrane protease YdiL (CAAX protease family)